MKNALEASPEGDVVTIALDHDGDMAHIRIRNRGCVPEEIRERFFEKYVTSGKTQGTGLGTYSAKLIAETQGGQIAMTSSEREGTVLTVRLPVVRNADRKSFSFEGQTTTSPAQVSETASKTNTAMPPIRMLPPEELHGLYNAAMIGDIQEIQASVARLEQHYPQFASAISTLRQLADTFQVRALLEFLVDAAGLQSASSDHAQEEEDTP